MREQGTEPCPTREGLYGSRRGKWQSCLSHEGSEVRVQEGSVGHGIDTTWSPERKEIYWVKGIYLTKKFLFNYSISIYPLVILIGTFISTIFLFIFFLCSIIENYFNSRLGDSDWLPFPTLPSNSSQSLDNCGNCISLRTFFYPSYWKRKPH